VDLDTGEIFRQDLSIAKLYACSSLGGKFMDHQGIVIFIIIMQTRLLLRENKVRLKANNIVQEAAELVNFATNNDVRS